MNKKKIVVKFLNSSYELDSRDKREVSVLSEIFSKVYVLDYRVKSQISHDKNVIQISREKKYSKFKIIRLFQIIFKIFLKDPLFINSLSPDVISCHDLNALMIGWISTIYNFKKKPKLIYDSHEFELGRKTIKPRNFFHYNLIKFLESYLIKKCSFSIMVNESIANEVTRIHNLKTKPIVVKNLPKNWIVDEIETQKTRIHLNNLFQSSNNVFTLIYHGYVTIGRGVENLIEILKFDKDLRLVILGYCDDQKYFSSLQGMVKTFKVEKQVLFHDAVEQHLLRNFIAAADLGMVTFQALSKSYYFALPNKFFECIQSLTPVITSNYPEISNIVNKYKIGLTVNPNSINEIYNAVKQIKDNKFLYQTIKTNLAKAKLVLNWENESLVLINEYKKLLN